jgi:hypothetical protein
MNLLHTLVIAVAVSVPFGDTILDTINNICPADTSVICQINLHSGYTPSGMVYQKAMSSRPNVIITGHGPGVYSSLTDPTDAWIMAEGGSVVEGPLEFTTGADNTTVEHLSVSVGDSAINKGLTPESDAINFYSPYDTVYNPPIRNPTVNDVTTLNRNATSMFHGVKCENVTNCVITNSVSLWGTHGFTAKFGTGFDLENLLSIGHNDDCLIVKSGTDGFRVVASLSNVYANNITCASAQPGDTNGVYIQAANGSISDVSLNNLTLDGVMTGLDISGDNPATGFGTTGLVVNGLAYTASSARGDGAPRTAILVEGLVGDATINNVTASGSGSYFMEFPWLSRIVAPFTINNIDFNGQSIPQYSVPISPSPDGRTCPVCPGKPYLGCRYPNDPAC